MMVGVVRPPINNINRQLGDSGDDGGYLVDSDGNAYPPYALSWRYLGVFLDTCNNNNNDDRRNRNLEENNNNNNNYSCRKVLWAAYHDPGYQGLGIAEYKFYQRETGKWDGRTCRAQQYWPFIKRCQRLNCHEAHTKWELVGVFKQTDGLYDFTEQLFKHQGYCLWDADKDGSNSDSSDSEDGDNEESSSDYNFMTTLAENWVAECTQHESFVDANGNALYYDTKPLAAGFMTYGVYTDASCLTESDLTWSDILEASDNDNDNDNDVLPSIAALDRWNALLGDYKICQPCRAYNRVTTDEGGSGSGDGSEEDDSGDYEDGDDGEGGKDRSGFDCYDAAGYLNCNQCYKFQTQTDMEVASTADLESATIQGTILALQVDGITYGQGHYVAPGRALRVVKKTSTVFLSTLALVGVAYYYYNNFIKDRRLGMENAADLKEKLHDDDDDDDDDGNEPDGIFLSKTRSRSGRAVTATDEFFEKKALEALVQEQDAQLSQQQQLIQRLQQRLDNYESNNDTNNTTEGAAAQQRTTAVVKEEAAEQAITTMEEAVVEVNVEEETVEVKVKGKGEEEEEAVVEVNRKEEEIVAVQASGSSGGSGFSKTPELGPATTSTSDDLKDYLDSLENSAPPTPLPIVVSEATPTNNGGVYAHARRTTLTKKSAPPATRQESSAGGIVGETVDVWSEFLGLKKTKYQIQAEHVDEEESSQVDEEIDEERSIRCIRTIKTNSKKKKKSSKTPK
mmetsp:Transcript_6680/g.7523  ORF Transcript_6680/g.7523 Transcript_6680/m.7523 type:complete len:737 (+) Transcript_6680:76-2286(+)